MRITLKWIAAHAGVRSGLVALLALLTLLLLGAVAAAGVKQQSASVKLAPGAIGTAKASCGKRTLLAAGFDSPDASSAGPVVNHGLRPSAKRLKAVGTNSGPAAAREDAYAYCVRDIAVSIRWEADSFVPGRVHNTFVECPTGTNPVSGGWTGVGSTPGSWGVVNSLSQGDAWVVSTYADGSGSYKAYAICADLELRLASSPETAIGADALVKARARCSGRRRVVSGGFLSNADEGTEATNLPLVQGSRRTGKRSWTTVASARTSATGIQGLVYCARKRAL